MLGADLEGQCIKKSTYLQSDRPMGDNLLCDKSHGHLCLRGAGLGGARTAQAAKYPEKFCGLILNDGQEEAPDGRDVAKKLSQSSREMMNMISDKLQKWHTCEGAFIGAYVAETN